MATNKSNKMTEMEIQELTTRIKALSTEELAIVANTIPVELCIQRVLAEISELREFKESVSRIVDNI